MNKLLILLFIVTTTLFSNSLVNNEQEVIKASSFNIKWLGYSKKRDNVGIAKMLSEHDRDLVIIQELVAPPIPMQMPNKLIKADKEVLAFFEAMEDEGYSYILSEEDTGTGNKIHSNSAATEWFVAFYKEDKLSPIKQGYIASDRSNHDDYERVPYYFTFKTNTGMDFVIISTHLKPGKGKKDRKRRYHELNSIFSWITDVSTASTERDFIVLGDMNVYDCERLDSYLVEGFIRANTECLNSNLKMTEPYDQVLYVNEYTKINGYQVLNLYDTFEIPKETKNKEVIAKYSDHHPVFFNIVSEVDDD